MTYALWPAAALALFLVLNMAASAADDDKEFKLPPLDHKDWQKLENGMRVWDVKVGDGAVVKKGATVKIHYIGWLTDGTVFDSSKKGGGKPVTFPLPNLIKGWQEAVPGMKVGGVRRMEIPAKLGYGERGSPPVIPANATLIFEIEVFGAE